MAILITDFFTIYADRKVTSYGFRKSILQKPRCIYIQLLGSPDTSIDSVRIQSKTDEQHGDKTPHPEFIWIRGEQAHREGGVFYQYGIEVRLDNPVTDG